MKLKKISIAIIVFFLLTTILPVAHSGSKMREGLWEVKSRVEIKGMPFAMPARTFKQCITKEDPVPRGSEEENDCEVIKKEMKGDTFFWEMVCKGDGDTSTLKGEITYGRDTFDGTVKMTEGEGGEEMITHMSGRYIGPCEK